MLDLAKWKDIYIIEISLENPDRNKLDLDIVKCCQY